MKNNSLLGFEITGWDWITFGVLVVVILGTLAFVVWMMGLPGRIAVARKHPDAEAVKLMGYTGFLMAVPWIQAFVWAYKPTDIIDIRRFPKAEAEGIDEEVARLSGKEQAQFSGKVDAKATKPEAKPAEDPKPKKGPDGLSDEQTADQPKE